MKKIAIVFVLILAFCGCENSSEPSLEERFSCKFDGKLFVAAAEETDNVFSQKRNLRINYYNLGVANSYFLSISASGANNDGFAIGCDSVIKVNVQYPIFNKVTFYRNGSKYYYSTNGKLTISEIDTLNKKIKGKFYFTAKEENGAKIINITEGRFNASYTPSE